MGQAETELACTEVADPMFITPLNRVDLLQLLPKGLVTAEIGVYRGGFSAQIIAASDPAKLYAIDPWGGPDDAYVREYRVRDDMEQHFEAVTRMFSNQIASGQVEIVRDYSREAIPQLEDGHLDWAYIDGMHSYDAVLGDLELIDPKIRADGLIWGHDFSNTFMSRAKKFGVVRAVREFLHTSGYTLQFITNESAPSFVIAKQPEAEFATAFRDAALRAAPRAIGMDIDLLDQFHQEPFTTADGRTEQYFCFGK